MSQVRGAQRRISWRGVRAASLVFAVVFIGLATGAAFAEEPVFVTRSGDKLLEGENEFRFMSFNIPNLHYVEDDMRFEQGMPFRWPTEYEIEDALESVRRAGGTVVRIYTLSVRKADDPPEMPRHVLAPGEFDERGFEVLDTALDIARSKGIRLIIPFVDNWHWWGGVAEYAAFRGKQREAFWSDAQLIGDFQQTIEHVVTRKNTRNGIVYRDDPTILAWETGNELGCPHEWTRGVAAYVKQLDPRHLVLDGKQGSVLQQESIDNPHVDFLQTHHYEKDARQMLAHIRRSAAMARGNKPYHVGEFGFLPTGALSAVMDAIIEEGTSGGLVWSLRYHDQDGGFYWHHEPHGGDLFKAYHWPGFASGEPFDETRFLEALRDRAYAIRGLETPPHEPPGRPELIEVTPGGLLTWRGAAGASGYDVERAEAAEGPWLLVGHDISDARVQHRPLFADESVSPGRSYHYRVRARNEAGVSEPSEGLGPIEMTRRTLVDELWSEGRWFHRQGELVFETNQARRFKEDAHRLSGERGAAVIYRTQDPIREARVYVFAESDGAHVALSVSRDGRTFEECPVEKTAFSPGDAATYGYWVPILYRVAAQESARFLRLEFRTEAQLSRVEIDY